MQVLVYRAADSLLTGALLSNALAAVAKARNTYVDRLLLAIAAKAAASEAASAPALFHIEPETLAIQWQKRHKTLFPTSYLNPLTELKKYSFLPRFA